MTAFKQKTGKLRFDLIPPELDLAYAEVATFGIEKLKKLGVDNPERNWEKGLKLVEDHLAAAERHINKWKRGIDLDEESGLSHLKHALWHIAGMVTHIERGRTDLDDRPSKAATINKNTQLHVLDNPYFLKRAMKDNELLRNEIEALKKQIPFKIENADKVNDAGCIDIKDHLENMRKKPTQYFKGE